MAKIRVMEIIKFLKDHNLTSIGKDLNSETLETVLTRAMMIMVEEGRIQPFAISGKMEAEIFNERWFNSWYAYDALPKKRKEIVFNAMDKEGVLHTHIRNDFEYSFANLLHYQLPRSYHEHRFVRFNRNVKSGNINTQDAGTRWELIRDAKSVYKVYKMEELITKQGFKRSRPILLQVLTDNPEVMFVFGGNHRLQAMRNLMKRGKVSKRYKIPCILARADPLSTYVSPPLEYD